MKKALRCVVCVIVSAAVCLSLCLSAACLSYIKGDADGNGEITSLDVTLAQRVLTGIVPDPDGMIARRCDLTGDGLTLPDVTEIQRYLAGFDNFYHIGEPASEDPTVNPAFPTEENQLPVL